MTKKRRWYQALATLALVALLAPGCRRPTDPEKAPSGEGASATAEAPAKEAAPPLHGAPSARPTPDFSDDDILADAPDVGLPEFAPEVASPAEAAREAALDEEARTRTREFPAKTKHRTKAASPEDELRSLLQSMRRSVDRRLLWARLLQERASTLDARSAEITALEKRWELALRVPDAPETDALGTLLAESADAAGLPLTNLTFELSRPDTARLPEFCAGNKPFNLTEADLLGTVHIAFILGTEDKARLASWTKTLPSLPRFVIVNRIRYTGEAFQVLADAYYLSTLAGPTRREESTDITAELKRAGITKTVEAMRMQDREHFLLATEISLKELGTILEEANQLSAVESKIRRREAIHAWYERRLKARTARSLERLLR